MNTHIYVLSVFVQQIKLIDRKNSPAIIFAKNISPPHQLELKQEYNSVAKYDNQNHKSLVKKKMCVRVCVCVCVRYH